MKAGRDEEQRLTVAQMLALNPCLKGSTVYDIVRHYHYGISCNRAILLIEVLSELDALKDDRRAIEAYVADFLSALEPGGLESLLTTVKAIILSQKDSRSLVEEATLTLVGLAQDLQTMARLNLDYANSLQERCVELVADTERGSLSMQGLLDALLKEHSVTASFANAISLHGSVAASKLSVSISKLREGLTKHSDIRTEADMYASHMEFNVADAVRKILSDDRAAEESEGREES